MKIVNLQTLIILIIKNYMIIKTYSIFLPVQFKCSWSLFSLSIFDIITLLRIHKTFVIQWLLRLLTINIFDRSTLSCIKSKTAKFSWSLDLSFPKFPIEETTGLLRWNLFRVVSRKHADCTRTPPGIVVCRVAL